MGQKNSENEAEVDFTNFLSQSGNQFKVQSFKVLVKKKGTGGREIVQP